MTHADASLRVARIDGAIDFDPERLATFLSREFGDFGALDISRVGGGQSNPTYFIRVGRREVVLRKRPNGATLSSAHAIDREFKVLQALVATPVPAPRPLLYRTESDVVGTPFYLMERLKGRVFHDSSLPGVPPAERRQMYLSVADALAALHALDPKSVGLADFGRSGDYFARQLARWSRQWAASVTRGIPELDAVIAWLEKRLPEKEGPSSITHGDYRIGNLMFDPVEPRVIGILDWELATLGDPLADLGFCCMTWFIGPEEYAGIAGLDLDALGIPTIDNFVARYEKANRFSGRLKLFHIVFALFRFAVIFVGIADRARSGTAADAQAATTGRLAGNFARRALEVAASDGAHPAYPIKRNGSFVGIV
jgi:aminoglycoside phosphotransferase (APT) family kinase protein